MRDVLSCAMQSCHHDRSNRLKAAGIRHQHLEESDIQNMLHMKLQHNMQRMIPHRILRGINS